MPYNPDKDSCTILAEAKELIQDKSNWYQGALVEGDEGIQEGHAWCALGAVSKVAGVEGYDYPDRRTALGSDDYQYPNAAQVSSWLNDAAVTLFDKLSVVDVNDEDYEGDEEVDAHARVMQLFDKAAQDHCF